MDNTTLMIMTHAHLVAQKAERQEQDYLLRWMYGDTNSEDQPGRMGRLVKRSLYVIGRGLVSLGERMQQPRHDIPATFPAMK
jgi:hypothetical protein